LWAAVSAAYSALLSSSYFERINDDDDDDDDVTSVFYDGDDEELLRLQSCERRSRYGEGCSRANRTNIAALRFSSSFPPVFLSESV